MGLGDHKDRRDKESVIYITFIGALGMQKKFLVLDNTRCPLPQSRPDNVLLVLYVISLGYHGPEEAQWHHQHFAWKILGDEVI